MVKVIKNIRLLLLGLLLLNLSQNNSWAVDYTQDVNCVGAWLFTEGSGTTVDDASVNSNTGNFKGTGEPVWDSSDVPFHTSGSAPNSVIFDGSDDYIIITDSNSLDITTSFTFTFWFYAHTLPTEEYKDKWILGKDTNTGRSYAVGAIVPSGGTNHPKLGIQINGNAYTGNTDLTTEGWIFGAITYTSGTNGLKIYLGGNLDATQTGEDCASTNTDLYIGKRSYPLYEEWWDGNIAEPAIFNDPLTSTEINEIYDYGLKGQTNPIQLNLILNNSIFNNVQLN